MRKKHLGEAIQLDLENIATDDHYAESEANEKTIKRLRKQLRAIQSMVERVSTKKNLDNT